MRRDATIASVMPDEEALFFKKISQYVPAMIAVYNLKTGKYSYVSDGITDLLGFTPEDFLEGGTEFAVSLTHPDDIPQMQIKNLAALRKANETGMNQQEVFEYRMCHKNGTWRYLQTKGSVFSRAPDGMVDSVINVSIDITEHKRMEEEMRTRADEEPSMLEAIVQSSDDAIISKTLDGVIRSWNKGAERIFGYSAREAIGKHISLIIPENRHTEEDLIMGRLKSGEQISHFDTKRVTKDGRLTDVSLSISPVRNTKGDIIGASKIARDISDRKRHEDLLREEERRKDEFLALLAHELRNPLAPIASATEILKIADATSDDGKWAVQVIHRQLHHMRRLIDDLLDISRISRNKLQLHKEKTSVDDFLRSAMETSEPLIQDQQHQLFSEISEEPMHVLGDPVRLSQMISNLLTNAAKYTPPGGTIRLSAKRDGSDVMISVQDTGIGIAKEMLPKVFEMFVQGTQTPHISRGLGIGLTLVKRLLQMHGGSIEAHSEGEGKGSTFTVRLPGMPEIAEDFAERIPELREQASPLKILVVDDNKDALATLEMSLRLQGNTTATARDGLEAVHMAQKFMPDVILLDIGMPNMNGYEATKMIRSQSWGKDIRIIAVTGWGQTSDKKRAEVAGFDHHLTKPVNADELSKLLFSAKALA
jgi:PAS domain S-box-containing protein